MLPALAAIVVAGLALVLAQGRGGFGGTHSSAVVTGKTARITIRNYAYYPAELTVKAGATITVTNSDQTAHTLTANSGAFDSGTLNPGQTAHFTAEKAGTYPYHCQFHAFMTGTIKVLG